MSDRHPPLQITADEITTDDLDHIAAHGYIKRPGGVACNLGVGTGDNLRHALCELARRGLKPRLTIRGGEIVPK